MRRQELQGDVPFQALVAGLVDEAHAAFAKQIEHQVLPDAGASPADRLHSRQRRGRLDRFSQPIERTDIVVGGEQRLDLQPQSGVAPASLVEQARPIVGLALDRRAEDVLHALPVLGRHAASHEGSVTGAAPG